MRRAAALASATLALLARASQAPFQATLDDLSSWDFDVLPSINATGHLVFDTVNSFMQHWPNTRYRNGHSLVPGIVPVGTLLYHGRGDSSLPSVPEWVATDPEHSYIFCRGAVDSGCWHLTIVASRPLRVLYFDGSSAAKMRDGPMDTQDIVGWGEVLPDRYFDERNRIRDICDWGKDLGVDGYVRMEMDFEIMLCDFTSGVEVVAMANLASTGRGRGPGGPGRRPGGGGPGGPGSPGGPRHPPMEPVHLQADDSPPFTASSVVQAGSWHNRYPGDRRIQLDLTRLVSFYDTALVPSLVEKRFGLERWDHRLLGISATDVQAVMARLSAAYASPPETGSGIDWDMLFKVIVDRYDERLEMAQYVLHNTSSSPLDIAKKAASQFHTMLAPYILHGVVPPASHSLSGSQAWASPVFKFCATSHTAFIRRTPVLLARMTPAEHLLLNAVEETNREICRVIVRIWAEGVETGLYEKIAKKETDMKALTRRWAAALGDLMAWLDWSVWIKCRPACGFEELCYLPTWPFRSGPEDYIRPQPRCVLRLD